MTQEAIKTYNEGYYYYTGTNSHPRDHQKALAYFMRAAQLGVSEAMNYLGIMYEAGDCVEKNPTRAAQWFAKGITTNNKNHFALYNLGRLYYYGSGIPQSYQQAIAHFLRAAELGNSEAMNYLGIIYENGYSVDINYAKAVEWYLKSINANHKNRLAAFNMARMYYNALGVPRDMERAFMYSEAAITLGINIMDFEWAKACYMGGCILLEHYKDYKEAVGLFMMAAYKGKIPEAWHNLGWMAYQGLLPREMYGGNKRIDIDLTANYYYEEAAKLGYLPSMDEVGRLNIIYNDMQTAKYWLSKAAEKGYEPSIKRMKMLKISDTFNKIADIIPSGGASHRYNVMTTATNISDSAVNERRRSNFVFKDARGNTCTPGTPFYDYRGNICEWGGPFYDFKGNYCTPGGSFYDSKGNYCTWGSPFYDAQGNYIVP